MKIKSRSASLSAKDKKNTKSEDGRRRRIVVRLAAIFLVIVFLASECASLLPVE